MAEPTAIILLGHPGSHSCVTSANSTYRADESVQIKQACAVGERLHMSDIFGHWVGRYSYADEEQDAINFSLDLSPRFLGWFGMFRGTIQDQFDDDTVWNGNVFGKINGSIIHLSKAMTGKTRITDPITKD